MADFQSRLANMSQPFPVSAGILVALVIRFIIPHVPTGTRGHRQPFCFHRNDSLSICDITRLGEVHSPRFGYPGGLTSPMSVERTARKSITPDVWRSCL